MSECYWVSWSVPFGKEEPFREPKEPLSFGEICRTCRENEVDARFVSVDGKTTGYATADGDYDLVESEVGDEV